MNGQSGTGGLLNCFSCACIEIDKRFGIRGSRAESLAGFCVRRIVSRRNNRDGRRCEVKIEQVSRIDRVLGFALKRVVVVQGAPPVNQHQHHHGAVLASFRRSHFPAAQLTEGAESRAWPARGPHQLRKGVSVKSLLVQAPPKAPQDSWRLLFPTFSASPSFDPGEVFLPSSLSASTSLGNQAVEISPRAPLISLSCHRPQHASQP